MNRAIVFSWHSEKNVTLIIPFLRFLQESGFEPYVITSEAPGKMRLLKQGIQAFSINELAREYDNSDLAPQACKYEDSIYEIDLATNWLFTPEDPANINIIERTNSTDYAEQKTRQVMKAYTNFINAIEPSLIFTWNGAFMVTGALAHIAKVKNIKCYFLERGLFPSTLVIDECGVNKNSQFAGPINSDEFQEVTAPRKRKLQAFCKEIFNSGKSIVSAGEQFIEHTLRQKLSISDGTKVILLPLQIDTDSNIILNSDIYKNMTSLVKDVAEIVAKMSGYILVVKPHPEDKYRQDQLNELCESNDARISWEADLHSILKIVDIVVVVNSTVGLEALMQNKQVVCLGDSVYNNKGFTFDVNNRKELEIRLLEAASSTTSPHENNAFWLFLNQLITEGSFSLAEKDNWSRNEKIKKKLQRFSTTTKSLISEENNLLARNKLLSKMLNKNESLEQKWLIAGGHEGTIESRKEITYLDNQSGVWGLIMSLTKKFQVKLIMKLPNNPLKAFLVRKIACKDQIILD